MRDPRTKIDGGGSGDRGIERGLYSTQTGGKPAIFPTGWGRGKKFYVGGNQGDAGSGTKLGRDKEYTGGGQDGRLLRVSYDPKKVEEV